MLGLQGMEGVTAGMSVGEEKTAVCEGEGEGADTDCLDDVEEDRRREGGTVPYACTCECVWVCVWV